MLSFGDVDGYGGSGGGNNGTAHHCNDGGSFLKQENVNKCAELLFYFHCFVKFGDDGMKTIKTNEVPRSQNQQRNMNGTDSVGDGNILWGCRFEECAKLFKLRYNFLSKKLVIIIYT